MNLNWYTSIRFRLISIFLIIFIPLFTIIIHSSFVQKDKAYEQSTNNALWIAQNLAGQQQFVENNIHQMLNLLSQLSEVKMLDTLKVNKLFAEIQQQNPYYASLILVNTQGELISSGSTSKRLNISDRKYFSEVMLTKNFTVGEYTKGRISKRPVMHYALPVLNALGGIKAVLVTSFDLQYYDRFIKLPEISNGVVFTLLDHNGTIIYHSENSSMVSGIKERKDFLDQYKKDTDEGTFASLGHDAIKRLYGYVKLKGNDEETYMYITVGIPEKTAYAEYRNVLFNHLLVLVLGVVLVTILAYFFSKRYIIQPIEGLLNNAIKISEGNLDFQPQPVKSSQELAKLSNAFELMSEKLRFRDLERKRFEKELVKIKERFELAINAAKIGIWDWHIRNNVLVWDKNMYELYGITDQPGTLSIEDWEKMVYPGDLLKFQKMLASGIHTEQSFRNEFRIQHPKVGTKHIRIFADVIFDKEKKPVRLIGVNWDITERKELENNLYEAKETVENQYKLKSAYLANINHEIRTPIHGIIGLSQILKENDITREEMTQYLDFIELSGNKLMSTMANIIDFQLLEAGQLELHSTELQLSEFMDEVISSGQQSFSEKDSECQLVLDNNPMDGTVIMDKQRTFQILGAMFDHAEERLPIGQIHVGWKIVESNLVFYVKSDLPMDKKQQEESRKNTLSNHNDNNLKGLQLTLSMKLAEYMKGRVLFIEPDRLEFHFPLCKNTLGISKKEQSQLLV